MLSGVRLKQKVAPVAAKLHAAAHVHRLSILYLLAQEPMTVADIIQRTKLSGPLVSHHLKVLFQSGWVTKTKYGKLATYYLNPKTVEELKKFLF